MFTLQDGREHLYQWDINRYVIVNDPTICEVHFCNRTTDCSLVVEVKDGKAAIPNILLQDARPIRVYAFCDDQYTKTEQQFTVKSRTQPEDYVYEETETLQLSTLNTKVDDLVDNFPTMVKDEVNKQPVNAVSLPLKFYRMDDGWKELDDDLAAAFSQLQECFKDNRFPVITISYEHEGETPADVVTDYFGNFDRRTDGGLDIYTITLKAIYYESATYQIRYRTTFKKGKNKDGDYVWGYEQQIESETHIATEDYVDKAIAKVPGADLTGYATEEWVTQAIADSAQGETDLSNYYTKDEVETVVEEAIGNIDIPETDLTDYATKQYVDSLFEGIATAEEGSY